MPKDIVQSVKLLTLIQDKIDKDLFDFLHSLIDDISDFKQSLLGISRDENGQFLIYNQPVASAQGDQLVLLMNNLGKVALRQREPHFSYADLDVGNHIFGIPARVRYAKSTDTAGVGIYIWNLTPFNNEVDMFQHAAGIITITERGHYRVVAEPNAENVAGAASVIDFSINGALRLRSNGPVMAAANVYMHTLFYEEEFLAGDQIRIDLFAGLTRIGAGANTSNLFITRVN